MAQESRLVIVIDSKNAERNARNLGNELDSIERKGDFASKSMDSLSVATRQLAGYMAGLVTVSAAINNMDTYTGLQNRLKLVTNNQVELNKATEDTFRIAQKTYSAWDSVLQVYQRFSDNAKTLNLTMDDTARLTETVSKAVAISGASASAADAALVQFGQALASGTLRGEELNSVMEQTPALAKAIAQGMGITVGELRSVAAEGKITSQEIVKALRNVEKDVDALFAKTDITIGQSLTLLNNEITKFVGESGKGSGAAQVLAGTIQTLASNLDVLTSAMMVGGAYWLGTYIPAIYASGVAVVAKTKELAAQTVTQYAAIQAERAAAAQEVINTQAVVANTQATLAAIAAEKALEVQRLKSQITEKGRTATLTRMAELKKIEAQVTRELALAEEALAVAQSRSAAAGAASVGIGSRLLGLLGGPVGIGITVASLAAGYLLMRDNTAEANKKLEEQARVAEKTDEALKKLTGNDKTKAVDDLTAAFNAQNEALSKSSLAVGAALIDIENYARGNREVEIISQEARKGTISYAEAIERLNKIKLPTDLYENLKKQAAQYDENSSKANLSAEKLKLFGVEVNLAGNKAQNAAVQLKSNTDELNRNANAAERAAKAQKAFNELQTKRTDAQYLIANTKIDNDLEKNKARLEFRKSLGLDGTGRSLNKEEVAQFEKYWEAHKALKKLEDDIADSKRQQTKESEKRLKITQAELEVAKRSAALIEASGLGKYAESKGIPSSVIAGLLAQESKGIRDAKSHTGAIGYFQTTSGYRKQNNMSVADSYDLEKSGKIAIDNIAKVYEKTGNLAQAILSHNAGEAGAEQFIKTGKVSGSKARNKEVSEYVGKVSRYSDIIAGGVGKGGLSEGDSDRAYGEQIKARLELIKQGLNLQDQYESEQAKRTKARNEEINLAQQTGQANLIPKIKERFDAQDQLAQKQFDFEVNGYKWTEEQKLEFTKETNYLRLIAEGKLSDEQLKIAKQGLDEQYQHELELINLTKAARQSAYDQANLKALLELKQERDILAAPIGQRAGLSLQFGERNALAENDATLINKGADLKVQLEQKEITTLEYNKRIEDAVRIHEENKFKIQEEYAEKCKDLQNTQYEAELGMYSNLLSQASNVWGGFTQLIKDSAGEQSAAYKTMFLMQQAMSIASALVSTHLAAAQVMADPSAMTLAQKTSYAAMITGLGYANVGLIAAQTIAGFSDGGYTGNGLKHTPAGIVHKGEVVWSQDDIKRWGGVSVVESMRTSSPNGYANGGYVSNNTSEAIAARREARQFDAINSNQTQSSSSNIPIKVYVTVNSDGSSKTDTQNDSKQLGQMIGNAVRTIIRQEQRQGGLLSK
ncbi:tape measure protein [Acinetobacter baumannii]|uniref:tape measure protein n=1 Tax=Acinetobacter baumannii TaxID=470 RepID=UPI00094C5529|nr:tape measure protein [Acinetobacter baumannii]PNH14154.1 phage tail tape measure protein [Acinetobacter baumannii]UMO41846.1 tape measure protein [Acinetobacter baumannii]